MATSTKAIPDRERDSRLIPPRVTGVNSETACRVKDSQYDLTDGSREECEAKVCSELDTEVGAGRENQVRVAPLPIGRWTAGGGRRRGGEGGRSPPGLTCSVFPSVPRRSTRAKTPDLADNALHSPKEGLTHRDEPLVRPAASA